MTQRKLATFDIDGTLFRSGLYREVAYELMKMGAVPHTILEKTTLANREWRHRTKGNAFEEFEMMLVESFDSILPQLKISDYEKAVHKVIKKRADNVYVYTRNLIQQLKSEGYFLIAISGSQIELVEPFAKKYGFDAWVGQQWERGDEFFTGNIVKTHTNKDKIIQNLLDTYDLTMEDSYAVGDTNGDVGMLSIVDHPIAINPTHELYTRAIEHGWTIVIERKNMMYTLESNDGQYMLTHADPH